MSRLDISDLIDVLCERFGLDKAYVARVELDPTTARVTVYRGRDGRCKGPKYVEGAGEYRPVAWRPDGVQGEPAMELLTFPVVT